jgi:hypothetical protein
MAKPEPDYYDEPMTDQDPREPDEKDDENEYQTFLAPKSAFSGKDLDVGAVHRVKIERVLSEEIELRCVKSDSKNEDDDSELYD